jgi:hypothetical protein
MSSDLIEYREIRHAHFFAGLGDAANGFNKSNVRVRNIEAKYRCIGSIDKNADAVLDFKSFTGLDATALDLFDYEQYKAFHGCEPPVGWKEASTDDVRKAFNYETPHIIFFKWPYRGPSQRNSKANVQLVARGLFLALEAGI